MRKINIKRLFVNLNLFNNKDIKSDYIREFFIELDKLIDPFIDYEALFLHILSSGIEKKNIINNYVFVEFSKFLKPQELAKLFYKYHYINEIFYHYYSIKMHKDKFISGLNSDIVKLINISEDSEIISEHILYYLRKFSPHRFCFYKRKYNYKMLIEIPEYFAYDFLNYHPQKARKYIKDNKLDSLSSIHFNLEN